MAELQKQAIKSMEAYRRREQAAGWLFAAPAIIGFMVFTLLPMIFSLFWSLTDFNVFKSETNFIGFANYREMFSSKDLYFSDSLKATAYMRF